MSSFQISITPSRRSSARFVTSVRRALQKALLEEQASRGLNQSEIARIIGVHRSVINREFRGQKDLTLGRVAELAFALGRQPKFELPVSELVGVDHCNVRISSEATSDATGEQPLQATRLKPIFVSQAV